MKVKTSELIGRPLDWAVALCEGKYVDQPLHSYTPSVDWYQGGPIIDREEIGFAKYGPNQTWKAVIGATPRGAPAYGPTPLVAAMRCFCCSRLGDELEVPDELMET